MIISTREILNLPLDEVRPNPYQPRRIFDHNALDELAASIKYYGVLQPISVRQIGNKGYELVAGERRLRASRMVGLATIPAILVDIAETDSAMLALIENLQRRDLHFFEEAEGFRNLMCDYSFTQELLAERIGKNQSTVANKLRLLKIPYTVQKHIIDSGLTERHARALLRLGSEDEQLKVISEIIKRGLNVRKTEELIEKRIAVPIASSKLIPLKTYIRDIRILTNSIKEDLEMMRLAGMETFFNIEESDTGYDIQIKLTYAKEVEGTSA